MTEIRLHSKENPDGTFTYHAKCQLDSVTDMSGNTVDNPVRAIVWNNIQNKYVVKEESIDANDGVVEDVSLDDNFYDFANDNNKTNENFLGRECWCARIFHDHQPDFEMDDVLTVSEEASFCPIDTNADGVTSRRDVRLCDARAVIDRHGQILSKGQQCYSELPVVEFAKSTWPLCFFWWILLIYMLCGTHYGSRVMGFFKRKMLLKCIGLKKLVFVRGGGSGGNGDNDDDNDDESSSQQRRGRTPNEQSSTQAEEGTTEVEVAAAASTTTRREQRPSQDLVDEEDRNNNHDEEQGGSGSTETITPSGDETRSNNDSSDSLGQRRRPDPPEQRSIPPPPPPPPPPPLPPPRSETVVEERSEWSGNNLEAIQRDFGSYENYLILDNELRRQSNASNNEFVTWLWYSAVYTEVRRYRYEQWLERRERERFRRLGRTPSDEAEDNQDDDDGAITGGGGLLGSRRLDSVFWWPPSGPDGSRWEHLRSNNNNQRRTNEDGRPIDQTRLCLKTKRFSPEDSSSTASTNNNNDTTPPTTSVQEESKVSDYVVPEVSENTCSICLCELEEGDLVGDIPCGHLFHKDCLKAWLTKNNHCPICRMENIASHPVENRPRPCRRYATNANGNSPTVESASLPTTPPATERDRRAAYISALANGDDTPESGSNDRTHTRSSIRMFGW